MNNYIVTAEPFGKYSIVKTDISTFTLEQLQSFVDGYIESFSACPILYENNINIFLNEDGKLLDLDPTVFLIDEQANVVDIIVGNIIFCSIDKDGNSIPLNEYQASIVKFLLQRQFIAIDEFGNTFKPFVLPLY